jgi:predicted outer membrane protein
MCRLRFDYLAPIVVIGLVISGSAKGQNASGTTGTRGASSSRAAVSSTGQLPSHEQEIALTLLLGNQEEVALAQFAQQKSQSSQVKEFAAKMIQDHQPAVEKLQMWIGKAAVTGQNLPQSSSIPHSAVNQSPSSAPSRAGQTAGEQWQGNLAQSGASSSATAQRVNIGEQFHRKAAERCLALTTEELNQLNGEEFDKAYLAQQIAAHIQMLAKLEAAESLTSGELRQFVSEAIPTVKHHQMMAKQFKEQLKNRSGDNASARRPATTSRNSGL